MQTPSSGGSRSSSRGRGGRVTLSEINVTPFVDVMLVLLIVFMVSAPLMQQGVEVNLPKTKSSSLPQKDEPILVTILKNQSIEVSGKKISLPDLGLLMKKTAARNGDSQVLVKADQQVPYGTVAQVMAQIQEAKITRVGLVTAPVQKLGN